MNNKFKVSIQNFVKWTIDTENYLMSLNYLRGTYSNLECSRQDLSYFSQTLLDEMFSSQEIPEDFKIENESIIDKYLESTVPPVINTWLITKNRLVIELEGSLTVRLDCDVLNYENNSEITTNLMDITRERLQDIQITSIDYDHIAVSLLISGKMYSVKMRTPGANLTREIISPFLNYRDRQGHRLSLNEERITNLSEEVLNNITY